jgi:hypothetical protein
MSTITRSGATRLPATGASVVKVPGTLQDSDTLALIVVAALWALFFGGLGVAHWRARRASRLDEKTAGQRGQPREWR